MAVLVVIVTTDVKSRHLCTTLAADGLRFAVLLRDKSLDFQFAELQIGLDTEQCTAAANK